MGWSRCTSAGRRPGPAVRSARVEGLAGCRLGPCQGDHTVPWEALQVGRGHRWVSTELREWPLASGRTDLCCPLVMKPRQVDRESFYNVLNNRHHCSPSAMYMPGPRWLVFLSIHTKKWERFSR